jgi:5-methyltetrahydrofolate--homocysteine methyltransferase
MPLVTELYDGIIAGNKALVESLVQSKIDAGADAEELLMESMVPAMKEIGERFSRNEVFVPEMLIAARAMQAGLDILDPVLSAGGHQPIGKVAIGTVKGDLHDIGKNLVSIMLKGAGFEVDDLGVDCSVEKFAESIANGSQVVLCSAMLTTTMPYMKTIAEHFSGNDAVKVVIGGAPVTQNYADEIGADGYGDNASSAAKVVSKALGLA